jgi:glycosyl transferase family 87
MKQFLLLILVAGILLALIWLPLPIATDADFRFLYHAALGLRQNISPYDLPGQAQMIASLEDLPPGRIYAVPYAYPPWYALGGLPLAFFNPPVAARLWFLLNLGMLAGAVWLLTDGWPARKRLAAFPAAVLFLPAAGGLYVGQFDFPTLLGTAMLGYALTRQRPGLTALAFALLTFKPQVGIFTVVLGLAYLILRRDDFSRKALRFTLVAGLFLFVIGFAASRAWPLDYLRSLALFKEARQCTQCNSLSMTVSNLVHGNFDLAIAISALLLILAAVILVRKWPIFAAQPGLLVAAATLAALLSSPFLHNYDYLLLLVPLLTIAGQARGLGWLWLGVAYLLPYPGLLASTFQGDFALVVSTLIVLVLFVRLIRGPQAVAVSALP